MLTRVEKKQIRKRQLDWILPKVAAFMSFVITASVGLLLCFALWWPINPPIVWNGLSVQSPVAAGTYVTYHVNACKYKQDATVERDIVGVGKTDGGYPLPLATSVTKLGCGEANLSLFIPPTVAPGTYQLWDTVVFQINPLRTWSSTNHSNTFVVTAAKPSS